MSTLILRLARYLLAAMVTLGCLSSGCVPDDEAAREPHAKAQKVLVNGGSDTDPTYSKDQKAVEQDEASSKG